MNFRCAYQKLQLQLAANFNKGDLWVTFGYDDDHLPANRKEAKKQIAAFFDRLRKSRKLAGKELKYVYVIHELQDDGSRRLHHHLVISATGEGDYDEIRSLWPNGSNIEICRVADSGHYGHDDFLELAQYLIRERNPDAKPTAVGDKGWCSSRNLVKPEVHSEMVDENITITAPPGAFIIDTDSKRNEYGVFDYIVYLLPERPATRPRKE